MGESLFFSDKIKLLGAFRLKFKYVAKLTLPPSQRVTISTVKSGVWQHHAVRCFFNFSDFSYQREKVTVQNMGKYSTSQFNAFVALSKPCHKCF